MNFYCAACDKRLFDGTIKLCRDNNISRRPTRTRITWALSRARPRCRRGRASKFGNYFLDWLERAGSSISQSRIPTLCTLSTSFSLSPRFAFFCCSSLPLGRRDSPLAFPREHNYRLRVPSQWMVNGVPCSEYPSPIITGLWLTRTSRGEVSRRPRYPRASRRAKRSDRAICLILEPRCLSVSMGNDSITRQPACIRSFISARLIVQQIFTD